MQNDHDHHEPHRADRKRQARLHHLPKGIKISDHQMKDLEQRALNEHQFHGEWNHRLIPAQGPIPIVLFIDEH